MKKIYILTAVFALLTLSLNAQDGVKVIDKTTTVEKTPKLTATANKQLTTTTKAGHFSFNEMLSGIKGMSSVLHAGQDHNNYSANGQSRAPLRINSDEYTVGPFEGDNFSTNGLGFPTAYGDNYQQIYITTELDRNEFIDHNGDEIVGFRFALAGNSSQKAVLYDFIAWPHSNGYFSQNRYTWSIPELSDAPTAASFDDIVITVPGNSVVFSEITVYDQDDNVLVSWNANSTDTYSVSTSSGTATAYNLPQGWSLQNVYMFRWSNNGNYYGYLSTTSQSAITIDASYLDGCTGGYVVIGAMGDYGTETLDVNGDTRTVTTSIVPYTFNLSPSGGIYVELDAGQWHEFYLDEPIPFNVADSIVGMRMGYRYFQYPSTETSELLYPIAVNPNSTSHNHVSFMVKQTGTTTENQLLTGWDYATNGSTFPTTWTIPSNYGQGTLSGSFYFGTRNGANIVIPASDLQGLTNVTVKVTAGKENNNSHTLTVNGTATSSALTTSLLEYTWNNVNASSGITIHVSDYYVDISKIEVYGTVTVPTYQQTWWTEDLSQYGDLAVQLIFKSSLNPTIEITPATQTINDAAAGTFAITGTDIEGNINVSLDNNTDWYLNPTSLSNTGGDVSVSYTGRALSASNTVTASAANDNTVTASATVNYVADVYIVGDYGSGWDFTNGTQMSYNNGIYTASLTVDADTYILFARILGNSNPWGTRDVFGPDSNGNWWMQGNSAGGNLNLYDDNCIYFPDAGTYTITIDANNGTFTITKRPDNQTATPVITSTDNGESVIITATGDGTVTLTVGGQTVSGDGSASITIPYGPAAATVTATATAQEDGKAESDRATAQVTIPGGGSDWLEMDGTYDNLADLLSFEKGGKEIMLVDQFWASTMHNDHKDGYTYTLREVSADSVKMSTPVDIPVYKTSSTMQGLYTLSEIESDTDMHLKAQALNSAMAYEVDPDHNTLYHSLYRGALNADYPEITVQSRVSQLQKYEENVDGTVHYFFTEMHTSGVTPRYDHVANEIVTPLDTNYVTGIYEDEISYVPVIWTFGLYSGREDGKNNSYGSDIKREKLGKVDILSIGGSYSGENNAENTGHGWEGLYEYNGVTYCIYTPIITAEGIAPETLTQHDGDLSEYEPYMFRAWCLYNGARYFDNDAQGILIDGGERPAPFLLGEVQVPANVNRVTIGRNWQNGEGPLQWAFAVPVGTQGADIQFAVRFYYKKKVTEAGTTPEGDGAKFNRDGDAEYYIVEDTGNGSEIGTFINEFLSGKTIVGVTYVNAQGMTSDKPFSGLNIVVTRYSDGTTSTTKVIK